MAMLADIFLEPSGVFLRSNQCIPKYQANNERDDQGAQTTNRNGLQSVSVVTKATKAKSKPEKTTAMPTAMEACKYVFYHVTDWILV